MTTNSSVSPTDTSALLRIGDVVVGPKAFLSLTQDIMKEIENNEQRPDDERADGADAALDNLFNAVWRIALAWWDNAEQMISAQELRVRAIRDAFHLNELCEAIPDGPDDSAGSGYTWASKLVTKWLAGINHGPLEWGWAAVLEGARPEDNGTFSIGAKEISDFARWAAMDPRSSHLARVLDFADTWPERILAEVLFLGPQVGHQSIDFRTDDLSAPTYQCYEEQPTLVLALSRGAWEAAELIWKRTTPQDSVAATGALRAVLQYLFSSAEHINRDEDGRDTGAPLRWAKRLVAGGADINAVIEGRYLGQNRGKPSHRYGRRRSPPAWRINRAIVFDDDQPAWEGGQAWSTSEYASTNATTSTVRMTLSELAAMTLLPVAMTQTQGGIHVDSWARFWVEQWTKTPPVLLLPWHAHGSMLDVVMHHGLWEIRRGRSGAVVQQAFDRAVRQISALEGQQGQGWWTRPPTSKHPWPAWEMAVQAWAGPRPVSAEEHNLVETLLGTLDTLSPGKPLPLWVMRDVATAVMETAMMLRPTSPPLAPGPTDPASDTRDPWTFVEQLAARGPVETQEAVASWMTDAKRALDVVRTGRTPDGRPVPDVGTARSVRDKMVLLMAAFPEERVGYDAPVSARPRLRHM